MKSIKSWNRHLVFKMAFLFMCFCSFSSLSLAGDINTPVKFLVVWDKDGSSVVFPLNEKPCLTFDVKQSKVRCVTSTQSIDFSLDDVHKYTLEASAETKIEELTTKTEFFNRNSSSLIFDNFPVHSQVRIYLATGKLFQTYSINEDGCLRISIQNWPSGLYLIKTKSVTYKILKK